MIKILNKRQDNSQYPDRVYVGRPTILGNPFTVAKHGHGTAIARFRQWLGLQWESKNRVVVGELFRLARKYEETGELQLECWCSPKPCHAEVIAEAVTAIVKRGDHK